MCQRLQDFVPSLSTSGTMLLQMRTLPAGTVTFLFTDIEGSTRLLHELGPEGYAAALAEHRRVLRQAFAAHGGVEVDTQGDAFFVAFRPHLVHWRLQPRRRPHWSSRCGWGCTRARRCLPAMVMSGWT